MNTLDLIVLGIVAISALFAFVRGFVKEVLSLIGWIGAILVTYYFYFPMRPIVRGFIQATWVADIVTAIGIFVVAMILFAIITGVVSSHVRQSSLGPVDRVLGLAFGLVRGALIVCVAYLGMTHFMKPDDRPAWIVDARSRPLLETGAMKLAAVIPTEELQHRADAMAAGARAEAEKQAGRAAMSSVGLQGSSPSAASTSIPNAVVTQQTSGGQTSGGQTSGQNTANSQGTASGKGSSTSAKDNGAKGSKQDAPSAQDANALNQLFQQTESGQK